MICTYCRRELDDVGSHTYQAIAGWEAIDGTTDLRWIGQDIFALPPVCRGALCRRPRARARDRAATGRAAPGRRRRRLGTSGHEPLVHLAETPPHGASNPAASANDAPSGIRTRSTTLKGWRPGPLVDGGGGTEDSPSDRKPRRRSAAGVSNGVTC